MIPVVTAAGLSGISFARFTRLRIQLGWGYFSYVGAMAVPCWPRTVWQDVFVYEKPEKTFDEYGDSILWESEV